MSNLIFVICLLCIAHGENALQIIKSMLSMNLKY